jgi:pyruvate formate lyase activating enzyme
MRGVKASMKLPICSITPFTMQDFPNHTACILWFGGCNMRCGYCHNPELVLGKKKRLKWDDIYQFLDERRHLLDGVVLSGGECTLSPELPGFIKIIRKMDYKVKLDTNGLRPDILQALLTNAQLDFVALDYKAPEKKFLSIVGQGDFALFKRSLNMLCQQDVPFEVRTTIHTALMDTDDISAIINDLDHHGFTGNYYLQNYQQAPETICPMPAQNGRLNIAAIAQPKAFSMQLRNF